MDTVETLQERVAKLEATLDTCKRLLQERVAKLEATLDKIAYLCADFDADLSQAESMLGEPCRFERGQVEAGARIEALIKASGYTVKDRPEGV